MNFYYNKTTDNVWHTTLLECKKKDPIATAQSMFIAFNATNHSTPLLTKKEWDNLKWKPSGKDGIRRVVFSTPIRDLFSWKWGGTNHMDFISWPKHLGRLNWFKHLSWKDTDSCHLEFYAGSCSRLGLQNLKLVFQLVAGYLSFHDIRACIQTYSRSMTVGMMNNNIWKPYVTELLINLKFSNTNITDRYRHLSEVAKWSQYTFAGKRDDLTQSEIRWILKPENRYIFKEWSSMVTNMNLLGFTKEHIDVVVAQDTNNAYNTRKRKRDQENGVIKYEYLNITRNGYFMTRQRTRTYSRKNRLPKTVAYTVVKRVFVGQRVKCCIYLTPEGKLMLRGDHGFFESSPEILSSVTARLAIDRVDKKKRF